LPLPVNPLAKSVYTSPIGIGPDCQLPVKEPLAGRRSISGGWSPALQKIGSFPPML
jgi:hypothetical protein